MPTAPGTASLLASRLEDAVVEDIYTANAAVRFFKDTATTMLRLWKFDSIDDIIHVSFNDCAGPGSASGGSSQGAQVLCLAERKIASGGLAKISPIKLRANKIRLTVASTLAGEAVTFCGSVAEVEHVQAMLRDIIHNDVNPRSLSACLKDFIPVALESSEMKHFSEAFSVIDAKSVYDSVLRNGSFLRQDCRAAIDFAWPERHTNT